MIRELLVILVLNYCMDHNLNFSALMHNIWIDDPALNMHLVCNDGAPTCTCACLLMSITERLDLK